MEILFGVVVIMSLFFHKAWSTAKERKHYSRSSRALRVMNTTSGQMQPSWQQDVGQRALFTTTLCEATMRKGVPDWFLESIAGNEEGMKYLTGHAALMESYGATFREQSLAAAELVDGAWQRSQSRGY